jgi:transcriptional accessory protein Tex/SPT6
MEAYKIENYIIAADLPEDAESMFVHELGGTLPATIEEVDINESITRDDGRVMTIKEIINEELDNRQQWRRMGIPCETYRPFVIKRLT